jgi:ubiquinone/menaquinone biosynthesis C-methylase UbiE/pimeloyl-ACP methyl ester carboxylesterase
VTADRIPIESLDRLYPNIIKDKGSIACFLEKLRKSRTILRRDTGNLSTPEVAWIEELKPDEMLLKTQDFSFKSYQTHSLLFRFDLTGRPHFFSATALNRVASRGLRVNLPYVIYEEERRDRRRHLVSGDTSRRVVLKFSGQTAVEGEVSDLSAGGLSVLAPCGVDPARGAEVSIVGIGSTTSTSEYAAEVRSCERVENRAGWNRIGLSLVPCPRNPKLRIERYEDLEFSVASRDAGNGGDWTEDSDGRRAERSLRERAQQRGRISSHFVRYRNTRNEEIRAIVGTTGDPSHAPAVLIPPAWGKTKESLLLLEETILATFESAGEPLTVIRFDGIRKRGESHNDRECRPSGCENLNYSVSQGASDILATLDFLEHDPRFRSSTAIIVAFSIASIEARVAAVRESRGRVGGWINVVGAADLQSIMKAVSGGVDFVGGAERGIRFGRQDVQGMLLDIDRAAADAIRNRFGFLEDARRDMANVDIPITWICGRYDAWINMDRVRDILSFGTGKNRRIVEVPTGHQIRTSEDALRVFQFVSQEVGKMTIGRSLIPATPDPSKLLRRRKLERSRVVKPMIDAKGFWKEYLLGCDGQLGIELIASTSLYRSLMQQQIDALNLKDNAWVCDLGSGTGAFPAEILRTTGRPDGLRILEVDFVKEALSTSRERVEQDGVTPSIGVEFIAADLSCRKRSQFAPLKSSMFEGVLVSLLLNYIENPGLLLAEAHRILRSGGRLALSSLRQDADISMICACGLSELRSGGGREFLGEDEKRIDESLHGFINSAARLLELEERGHFQFWSEEELRELLATAGFLDVSIARVFGHPPQAFLASARAAKSERRSPPGRTAVS